MKDISNIKISEVIFRSRSHVKVLSVLAGVSVVLSVSQIVQQSGLTRGAVETALASLERTGIVFATRSGNARVFQLNRDNVFVEEAVIPLFQVEDNLRWLMVEHIKQALGLLASSIVMFGSFARQDYSLDSDVDIVVVTHELKGLRNNDSSFEQAFAEYAPHFRRRFGHSLEALVYDGEQAAELHRRAPALFEEILEDAFLISGSGDWLNNE